METAEMVCRNVGMVAACPAASLNAHHAPALHGLHGKGKWAIVWGVLGTVLSTLGFVAWALFEQYNSNLNELQRDLKHFHEASGDLVKKESLQRCYNKLAESTKELQASTASREQLMRELEIAQKNQREMERDVQQLRERLAAVEGRQSAAPVIVTVPVDRKESR